MGLGYNAQAGLITRGLAEMSRLACAAGAQRETLSGLAGLGDLVLTCTSAPSRNRRVGVELARGRPLQEILDGTRMVAEGVRTSRRRAGARRAPPDGAADRLAGGRPAGRPEGSAHGAVRADGAPAARRGGIASWGSSTSFGDGLSRTTQQLVDRFEQLVQQSDAVPDRTRPIDVDTLEALEELLLSADVGVPATERIVTAVRGRSRHGESLRELVKHEIRHVFDGDGVAAARRRPAARHARSSA